MALPTRLADSIQRVIDETDFRLANGPATGGPNFKQTRAKYESVRKHLVAAKQILDKAAGRV